MKKTDEAKRERDQQLRKQYPKLWAALHRKRLPKPRAKPTLPGNSGDLPPAA